MQLSSNFYELHCYLSNFIYINQFLAHFGMLQSLPFLMNMSIYILLFSLYYVTFFHKNKQRFSIQTTLLKCGQIFSLPQSIYKTEVGRVKMNRTNDNQNRPIKLEQILRLQHMKNKGVQQSRTLSRNSMLQMCEKSHTTHQVGMWWCVMIIPFRTPQFFFSYNDKYKL